MATNRQLRPLFTNQHVISRFEQGLNKQMQEAFSEINNVNFNMRNYSDRMEHVLTRVMDSGINVTKVLKLFQDQVRAANQKNSYKCAGLLRLQAHCVLRQLQMLQLIARMENLGQCREKKLPTAIVTLDKLRTDLLLLSQAVLKYGYELAILVEEVTKYLRLEIVERFISNELIIVN